MMTKDTTVHLPRQVSSCWWHLLLSPRE